ncbi:hypothetical protein LPJ66_007307 [Kickxella alabastrina]|uniref:Uncharacterized protein n=1 Tax=Kickxella alabastrina TaxID=61397 RepID=A0ACC1IHJ3_9FUNG|nr:hypothetical protein LPJ66_007307 [Kickxella alabastrina]
MQLADRNKADIERAAQERKRLAGVISNKDRSSEREADERRRKRLVEERIQQREHDESQRQKRAKMALERRKQERVEAERADEAQRKQTQRQKQQPMQQQQQKAGYAGGSGSCGKSSVARRPEVNPAVAGAKKPAETQPVSFQELMRIAAQNAAAPAKSADKAPRPGAQPGLGSSRAAPLPARSPAGRAVLQSAGVRRAGDRSRSPRKAARAQSPADNRRARSRSPVDRKRAAPAPVRSSAPGLAHRPAPVGTQHVRQPPKPTTTSLTHRMVAGKRRPAVRRDRADAAPALADPVAPKAPARLPPQEQQQTVRKPPEREIDRFGVRSGATLAARRPTLPGRGASRDSVGGAAERRTQPSALASARSRSIRDERDARSVRSPASRLDGRGGRPLAPPALRAGENSRSRSGDQRALPRNNSAIGRPNRAGGGGAMQKRRREEYYDDHGGESDYDSLDDFVVDDEEEGGARYREGAIRRMLGVQYRDVDDDDDDGDDMEVSASQLMREERISAKIGRQEDDEEERRQEEAERARKRRIRERERR